MPAAASSFPRGSAGTLKRVEPRKKHRRPKPRPGARAAGKPAGALRTDWGDVAEWYDELVGEEGSEYHRKVVFPGVLRLLGDVKGRRVLDVACGQGVFSRILRERGAQVVGVDAAGELVRIARDRSDPAIAFHVLDARAMGATPEPPFGGNFDAAVCVLAIQNIHPIQGVFAGVGRALREGGRFIVVMMHPAFRGPGETAWGWDEARRVQYRRVDRYLLPRKAPIVTHPGAAPDQYTWTFHKPIGAYVKAMRQGSMLVDALEEWPSHKTSQPGPRAAAENQARKEIPMFMAIRGIKVGALGSEPAEGEPEENGPAQGD